MPKSILFVFILSLFFLQGCDHSPALAKVGGKTIHESDLKILEEVNPRLADRLATPEGKRKIVENYVEQSLLYQEAIRRGLQRDERTKKKLDLYRQVIISQALLDDELDKKIKEYYDNNKDEFERVKVAHILIRTVDEKKGKDNKPVSKRTEEAAQALIKKVQERLQKGEEFGKIASEVSEDEMTKKRGGNLEYVTIRDKRLEQKGWLTLSEQAFALKQGDVSTPIKTKDGIHLIKVLEAKTSQSLEEASMGIRFRIQSKVRQDLLDQLKKDRKVQFFDNKPQATAPALPPGHPELEKSHP
ncbi:MAG: peptidylprolyl isomerase [Deltaproteobacteria bacterium]|nr:peptidylprolyl isomerase [Deltaproteobacteria bacterium]MBI2501172.1 peptidylprolyl isomerase [Deltaproteobacteria bacterium]MBI4197223.1 peptidylprolyl isomerase [Deltaproteobacteria bacterium]